MGNWGICERIKEMKSRRYFFVKGESFSFVCKEHAEDLQNEIKFWMTLHPDEYITIQCEGNFSDEVSERLKNAGVDEVIFWGEK